MQKSNLVEYVVISLYLVFMLITGFIFRHFNKNFNDYFRSGCKGTWWLVGASIFMASFTAWTFTGAAGVAYESGISVSIIFIANAVGYFINYLITAPLFRQMRSVTGPEVIKNRFDTLTQQIYVWVGVVPGILMASLTLYAVALFTSAVFGYNVQILIILLGSVVLIYSAVGGSWSVMATDFLQAMILMPMTVLVTYLSVKSIGGIGNLIAEIHRQNLPDLLRFVDHRQGSMFTKGYMVAIVCFVLISYNSLGSSVKFFACKDGKEAKKAALLAGVLMLGGAVLWFLPPMVARLKFASFVEAIGKGQNVIKPADGSYAVIAMQLLPMGLTGMMVVAMFSATMSSLSPALNQYAAIITQDVYKPFFRPKCSQKEMFVVGQITSIIVGTLIILSAVYLSRVPGKSLFKYMMDFGSLFGTPLLVPMFLGFFIKKTPRWAAIPSIFFGFICSYIGWKSGWSYERNVFTILIIGSTAYLITMFFWKNTASDYKERVNKFFGVMKTTVNFSEEVGSETDASQLKLVGYVLLSIGAFLSLCLFLPNPLSGRLQILFISGSIMAFGILMILTGYLREKKYLKEKSQNVNDDSRINR